MQHRTLKNFSTSVATLGLLWTLIVLAFVFFQNTREDDLSRRLRALAGVHLGAAPEDMTNEVIRIPRASVDVISDLARDERRRTDTFTIVLVLSAAVTAVVSFLLLASAKHDTTAA
jgi:hypothetical protein